MEVGDSYTFRPSALIMADPGVSYMPKDAPRVVTGTIERIHWEHVWFRVRWMMYGKTFYECFPIPASELDDTPPPAPEARMHYKKQNNSRLGKGKQGRPG